MLKIKEERQFKYTDGLIEAFADQKYAQLSYCYPEMNEATKIRTIVAALDDEELEKQLSLIMSNDFKKFKARVHQLDLQKNPFLAKNSTRGVKYNIGDYLNLEPSNRRNATFPDREFGNTENILSGIERTESNEPANVISSANPPANPTANLPIRTRAVSTRDGETQTERQSRSLLGGLF